MNNIGERIRILRKENKLTQVELGQLIGITGAGVSYIESGGSQPTEAALKLICSTYHIRYAWLVTGEGNMYEQLDTDALVEKHMAGESEFAKSIMKGFAKMPYEEWVKFRDKMEEIKKEAAW